MALARWRRAGLSAVNSFSGRVIFVIGGRLCKPCGLLPSPTGEGMGWLLGLRFAVMEANGAGCFFRRPFMGWIQAACKRFLIFQLFLFVAVYTSLTACCPLSNSLPRGERTGWLLELRVLQGKQVVQAAFLFFRRPFKRSIQAACTLIIFKNPIKISRCRHAGCFSFLPPHSAIIRLTPPVPAVWNGFTLPNRR